MSAGVEPAITAARLRKKECEVAHAAFARSPEWAWIAGESTPPSHPGAEGVGGLMERWRRGEEGERG
ncbi:MAG: hypothetical protein SGPRY_008243 [Prymnesium sp.]